MGFCLKCGDRWTGAKRCHCTGCHNTFSSPGGFDRHRRDFICQDPRELGMVRGENEVWVTPMSEEAKMRMGYR